MPHRRSWLAILAVLLVLPAASCGGDEVGDLPRQYEEYLREHGRQEPVERPAEVSPEEDAAAEPEGAPALPAEEPAFEGTAGPLRGADRLGGVATLRSVRAARNPGFDRVVFEFEEEATPGYRTAYIDEPLRECRTGRVVEAPGNGWLSVRLEEATAAGIDERRMAQDLPVLQALVMTCDAGARVEWVLAVRSPNRYRVITLAAPGRVVVDVLH